MATHFPGSLKTEQAVIEETLALWTNNVNETSAKPDGSPHWINKSMVRWLTKCVLSGSGQLSPDDEPLWLLTGFPEDPKAINRDAIWP